jgi:hypothetical protein
MARTQRANAMHAEHAKPYRSYAKRMSDHVAYALVVYTLMLIFVVTPSMESDGASILPYFILVVFVGMVIPACRGLEKRWQRLQVSELGQDNLNSRYSFDRIKLWVAAIGIPIIISFAFRGIAAVV